MTVIRKLTAEDAGALARLHALSFPSPWTEDAFATMLATPGVRGWGTPDAFLLFRATGDEGEIWALAVDPAARRRGRARALLGHCIANAQADGVGMLFLEVARENAAARALYGHAGFLEVARRPNYYRGTGEGTDGLVLRLDLPRPPEGVETRGGMV